MDLPVVFSQRDPTWAAVQLGTLERPGNTIGQYGCLLTCYAMLSTYYGRARNPADMNQDFISRQAFVAGNELSDNSLDGFVPGCNYTTSYYYFDVPADLGFLQTLLRDPQRSVILMLDFDHDPNDGLQRHFVVALSCDGNRVTVADPWFGTVDDLTLHYGPDPGRVIWKYIVYQGIPAVVPAPTPDPTPQEPDMTDDQRALLSLLASRGITTPKALQDLYTWGDQTAHDVDALRTEVAILKAIPTTHVERIVLAYANGEQIVVSVPPPGAS